MSSQAVALRVKLSRALSEARAGMRNAIAAAVLTVLLPTSAMAADDCPSAKSGKTGFVVERSGSSVTEIFHVDETIVRTVMRSGGTMLLETTQFQGLLPLERLDRGRRQTFRPKGELTRIFPLKTGQTSTAEFEFQEGDRTTAATVTLSVKEKDALFIGPCRYEVFKLERTEARGEIQPRLEIDYYAPDLKLVIAKEYKERNGRINLIKFDRIYPIGR